VLVIGANDVVNPAARHDTGSPIYGMPILDMDKARTVMVIKRSMAPGFAGSPEAARSPDPRPTRAVQGTRPRREHDGALPPWRC
jgi:hypothetical protein